MMNQDFDAAAYEAFQQAALDKYDFQTCQRSDGSYYGTGGTCKKGSPVSGGVPKDAKKGSSKSGGGGGSSKKKDPFAAHNKMAKKIEADLRKKYANKKPDGGLTEAQVRAGGGRLD